MNYDRLIAAINQHWRPVSDFEFWYKLDPERTNVIIGLCRFTKEINDWIWKKERKAFEVF